MEWSFIDTGFRDPYFNMGFDEALMNFVEKTGKPVLRFFNFSPPSITIGFHQRVSEWIISLGKKGYPFVRRPTGGRAVIHSGDMTYSLAFPQSDELVGGSVLESYKKISQGFGKGFEILGLDVKLERKSGDRDSDLCFNSPSWYEFTFKGKKIIGSAQVRRFGICLQQGTLAAKKPDNVFPHMPGLISVEEALGKRISLEDIKKAVKKGFEEAFGITFIPLKYDSISPLTEKYSSRDWNYKYA